MRGDYVVRRIAFFFLVVWLAASVNFFIPRVGGGDPVRTRLMQQSERGGGSAQNGLRDMVIEYNHKFGLDKPLWQQYLTYLSDVARLDFNYSISGYPARVSDVIARAIPWTVGLLGVTTTLGFLLGSLLGALIAWPKVPRALNLMVMPLMALSAIPYYLLALVLLDVFAFRTDWLPLFGGYSTGTIPTLSWSFAGDVLRHAILPGASIVLSAIGFWALGMRGMMVTVQGEDYMIFGEAKGLKGRTLFLRYGIRNAILPQTTSLAIAMGYILSGSVLVEVVFAYPGIGLVLYEAIKSFDFFLIEGIVFTVVLTIALATLIIDLILPLIDPRISYRRTP